MCCNGSLFPPAPPSRAGVMSASDLGAVPPLLFRHFSPRKYLIALIPFLCLLLKEPKHIIYSTTENATTCICITSREHSHCVSVLQLPGMLVPCDGFRVVEMHKWAFPLSLVSGDLWSTVALTDPSLLGVMLLWTPLPLSMGCA